MFIQVTLKPTTTCHHPTSPGTTCCGDFFLIFHHFHHRQCISFSYSICQHLSASPFICSIISFCPLHLILSEQHHSGSLCECDALPVSTRSADATQKDRHHDRQGEHRGRVQQPGARGVCSQSHRWWNTKTITNPGLACISFSLQNVPGVVECLKIITKTKSLRIADYAFQTARAKGRRLVTAVHKANIMSVSDRCLCVILFICLFKNTWHILMCVFVGAGSWVMASSWNAVKRLRAVILKSPLRAWLWTTPPCRWQRIKWHTPLFVKVPFSKLSNHYFCLSSSWCPSPNSLMWWWCPICMATWWATCAQAWWGGRASCLGPTTAVTMRSLKRWVFGEVMVSETYWEAACNGVLYLRYQIKGLGFLNDLLPRAHKTLPDTSL